MNAIDKVHADLDAALSAVPSCCAKGCHHCCHEPAYADQHEVRHMLDGLNEEQRRDVMLKTMEWIEKALASGLIEHDMPDAMAWRRAHIACPFLRHGLCMVYDRRPIGCREFLAQANPENCALPMREHQKFLKTQPESLANIMGPYIGTVGKLGPIHMDHIGVLLAQHLLGSQLNSGSARQYQVVSYDE